MQLERVTDTGVVRYRFIDWHPKGLSERERHGVTGSPLRLLLLHADRVEMQESYCFSSGHMDFYEDAPMEAFDHDDARVLPLVTERFGAEIAAEVAKVLADANAFEA
jgi:hypothetical protein